MVLFFLHTFYLEWYKSLNVNVKPQTKSLDRILRQRQCEILTSLPRTSYDISVNMFDFLFRKDFKQKKKNTKNTKLQVSLVWHY